MFWARWFSRRLDGALVRARSQKALARASGLPTPLTIKRFCAAATEYSIRWEALSAPAEAAAAKGGSIPQTILARTPARGSQDSCLPSRSLVVGRHRNSRRLRLSIRIMQSAERLTQFFQETDARPIFRTGRLVFSGSCRAKSWSTWRMSVRQGGTL